MNTLFITAAKTLESWYYLSARRTDAMAAKLQTDDPELWEVVSNFAHIMCDPGMYLARCDHDVLARMLDTLEPEAPLVVAVMRDALIQHCDHEDVVFYPPQIRARMPQQSAAWVQ